jgi:hypothetical protein
MPRRMHGMARVRNGLRQQPVARAVCDGVQKRTPSSACRNVSRQKDCAIKRIRSCVLDGTPIHLCACRGHPGHDRCLALLANRQSQHGGAKCRT